MKEKETKNKTACHPELVLLLFPKSSDFVKNVWFPTGSYQSTKEKEILNSVQSLQSQRVMLQNDKESSRHPERSEGSVNRFFGTSCLRMTGRSAAFTLAETLIALTILGIVAAITVPQLVRRQQETANRVKFKKAVMSYESVMNKIAIMNDLKSNGAIQSWATKDNTVSDCSVAYNYFKSVKDLNNDNKCKFKTADGVFWDITDLQKPIISIKENDLTDTVAKSDTNRAFYLYAQYDGQGILRVTEPNFNYTLTSDKTEVDASVDRLWAYLKGETNTSRAEVAQAPKTNADKLADCATGGDATCTITYNCPTQEDPTKTCELEMTKQTFDTTNCNSASSIGGPSNSCPVKPINYFVIPEDQYGKLWYNASCPEGTHMAKAGELAQMKSVLSANCGGCVFWAQEEYPTSTDSAYGFGPLFGVFFDVNKDYIPNAARVVCVGN